MILKRQDIKNEQGGFLQTPPEKAHFAQGNFGGEQLEKPDANRLPADSFFPKLSEHSFEQKNIPPTATAKEAPMTTTTMTPPQPVYTQSATSQNPQSPMANVNPNIFSSGNFAPPPSNAQPPQNQTVSRLHTRQESAGDGRRLVVGPDITLNGEISTCDVLVVEGNVQAALKDCKQIEIAAEGLFKGNAEIDNAIIAGVYEGNLVVRGKLHVMNGGRVIGSVRYGHLQVDVGGELNGEIQSLSSNAAAARPATPATAQPRPANRAASASSGTYNNLYGTNPAAASGSGF